MLDIIIQPWFLLAFFSAVALGVAELLQQNILNNKSKNFSPIESAFFTFFIEMLFLFVLIFVLGLKFNILNIENDLLFLIICAGIIGWPAAFFYLKSFEVKNISLSTIFLSSSIVVATFLGYLFLGEEMYFLKYLSFIFVLGAIVLVSLKSITLERNHFYGLLAGVLFGIEYVLASIVVDVVHPLVFIFWQTLIIVMTGLLFHFNTIYSKIIHTRFIHYQNIIISGFAYLVFNILYFYAFYFGGEAGKVDGVSSFNIFIIILFEYLVLRHRTDFWLKVISFIFAVIGIILLGFF